MTTNVLRLSGNWLLGSERHMRLRLGRTLQAAAVYAFALTMQWVEVAVGLTDSHRAGLLTTLIVCGVVPTYVAIRSGWSKRLADPALTLWQTQFAIVALALSYFVNPQLRGMVLMLIALVLMFGAFTLPPLRCRMLGWRAVAALGGTMFLCALLDPARFPLSVECVHFAFASIVLPTVAQLAGQLSQLRIDQRTQKAALRVALEKLSVLANRDALTGLPNRRNFDEWYEREASRCRRSGAQMCLAILDIDHFKQINDVRGHAEGDQVLISFAHAAKACLRDGDLLTRWGGEEFLLAMPESSVADALAALMRLRAHIVSQPFRNASGTGPVTFSAGVTQHLLSESVAHAVVRADSAMYAAKASGRDRSVVHGEVPIAL